MTIKLILGLSGLLLTAHVCAQDVATAPANEVASSPVAVAEAPYVALQRQWEQAKYNTPEAEREKAMEALSNQAKSVLADHPKDAPTLIWSAIVLSSYAGEKGGLGALSLVKEAKVLLEQAIEVDPNATPFSAGELPASQLSAEQRRVLRHVGSTLNMRDGWTFPIAYCGEMRGIMMLGGPAPDMSPLLASLLHLLTHTAFKRLEELAAGASPRSRLLTAREVECLRWVALGKTDEEIGVILSIRARTARFHVENAKRKLGVATRVQAVAQALKQQAIAA